MEANEGDHSLVDRLNDIRLAIRLVKEDIGGMTKEAFESDGKTRRAVLQGFSVIAEAAKAVMFLDPDLKERSPEAWGELVVACEMRQQLDSMAKGVVWDVAMVILPRLDAAVFWLLPQNARSTDRSTAISTERVGS